MGQGLKQVILIEPDDTRRNVLAGRLRAQRFEVIAYRESSEAANRALANPPHAIVADVWMPGVSGVQLCRLLRSEPSTRLVPIILRAEGNAPKARFWSEEAGATAYVPKGRIGELVRTLNRAIESAGESEHFFTQLAQTDIRDRIVRQLDRALFESAISSHVRALGVSESFERLFDLFSQFVCRVATYRWLAVMHDAQGRMAVHAHPARAAAAVAAAREALGRDAQVIVFEDEDAIDAETAEPVMVYEIPFGNDRIGRLAMEPLHDDEAPAMMRQIARELGGPLRIATLVEESQRLALYDPLTGSMNRRAFIERITDLVRKAGSEGGSVACVLLDVDHFKGINDTYGHKTGDKALSDLARLVQSELPHGALSARWGGEEFVIALPAHDVTMARAFAERLRARIEAHEMKTDSGQPVPFTASLGVSVLLRDEGFEGLIERADRAMYTAKISGRNRVELAVEERRPLPSLSTPGSLRMASIRAPSLYGSSMRELGWKPNSLLPASVRE